MKMHIFLLHYHDGHVPLVPQHTPTLFYPGLLRPVARASVALIEPAAATMSLTGKIMPDFHVKVLPADGGAPERVSAFSLVHGTPTVIHFYNSG